MSFSYKSVASSVKGVYNIITNEDPLKPDTSANIWMDIYSSSYDSDANAGSFTKPAVSMAPMASLLRFNNNGNAKSVPDDWAAAVTNYWAAQLTPGTPQYDGFISISNDASKIKAPLHTALLAYDFSDNVNGSYPLFEDVFRVIEDLVKSIIWTIVEVKSTSTITYTISIS